VGCGDIEIHAESKSFKTKTGHFIHEGDWLSLNGS
jgi:hypothetical protein